MLAVLLASLLAGAFGLQVPPLRSTSRADALSCRADVLRSFSAPLAQAPKKQQLDAAFTKWRDQNVFEDDRSNFFSSAEHKYQELLQREVNKLTSPEVPLRIVFEGIAQSTVLPSGGSTDDLLKEACRLHNLETNQGLRFFLNGAALSLGTPISATPLAATQDLEVHMQALDWPVRRGRNPSILDSAVAATVARRGGTRGSSTTRQLRRVQHCMAEWHEGAKGSR